MVDETTVELRKAHSVRELHLLEEGLLLSSNLPNGVYGFVTPWAITTQAKNRLVPARRRGGTAVLEVHKVKDGDVHIVGFVSRVKRDQLTGPTPKDGIELMLFTEPYNEFIELVSIPLNRIDKAENRCPGGRLTVIDLVVR